MPIKIADKLPARAVLEEENIFVMTENRALSQDIRPLKIALLNLMPLKIETEIQILRCLSNTPLQIEIDLIQTTTYKSTHTPKTHLLNFYKTFDQINQNKYDGMIITGAPIELMKFENVDYWNELCNIMDWSVKNVCSTLHICWGAQAALYHHYGILKHELSQKVSGVFSHKVLTPKENLFRGFDDNFFAPHSRYTEVKKEDILKNKNLKILSVSQEVGVYIVKAKNGRQIFVLGHCEYDANTLKKEYIRDKKKGLNPSVPKNYFPNNNPCLNPVMTWRSHGNLLYTNWLNYYVYQTTPYYLKNNFE